LSTRDRPWQLIQVCLDAGTVGLISCILLAGQTGYFRGEEAAWAPFVFIPIPLLIFGALAWAILRTSIREVEGRVEVQGLWRRQTVLVSAVYGLGARKMSYRRASAVLLVREGDRTSRVVVRALPYDKLAEPEVVAALPFLEPLL